MGLFRKAIVLVGLAFALPSPPAATQLAGQQQLPPPSPFATIAAAYDTISDVKAFCMRQPQACVTGHYLAVSLEGKLRYTTKLVYEWANGKQNVKTPDLRLATLADEKPKSIEDLIKGSLD